MLDVKSLLEVVEEELLPLCVRGALVAEDGFVEDDEEDAVEAPDVDELLDLVPPLLEPLMLESALFVKSELFVLDASSSVVPSSTLSSSYRPGLLLPSALESSRFEGNEGIASATTPTNFKPTNAQTSVDQMAQSLTVPLIVH